LSYYVQTNSCLLHLIKKVFKKERNNGKQGKQVKIKITVLLTTIMLGISSLSEIPSVKADTQILTINQELSEVQTELNKLNLQIQRVEQAVIDNNKIISDTEEKINSSQNEIKQLEKEIAQINEKVVKRNEVLKNRAISYQETGGNISYLDVLFGATSFSDFIDRIGAVATMVEADQEIVDQHKADREVVEKKQESVKNKLNELNHMKTELEGMRAQILEQKSENEAMKEDIKKKVQVLSTEKAEFMSQNNSLTITPQTNAVSNHSISAQDKHLTSSNGSVSAVIEAGYKYIGNSVYVFGGGRTASDIANGRFDCSGFVSWAFSQAGIKVGASTDSLKHQGTPVSVSQMQPGDIVFFDTYKKDGHVGIYVGGGKFIGSQSNTGVAIADMSSGYWEKRFNGRVNRIITQ
jgi:peptidoglycan DL-endopeptidase CwlO